MWDGRLKETLDIVQRGMDLVAFRRKLIASNVANAETPGYKALDVDFDRCLREAGGAPSAPRAAMIRTNPNHLPGGLEPPRIPVRSIQTPAGGMRSDGNTVDLEAEMAKIAQNRIRGAALTESLNRLFKILHHAISEGGGK